MVIGISIALAFAAKIGANYMVESIALLRKHLEIKNTTTDIKAKIIYDRDLYSLIESLTSSFRPTKRYSKNDTRWIDFYLPIENKKHVAIPFGVARINDECWLNFNNLGSLLIKYGSEKAHDIFYDVIKSTANFKLLADRAELDKLVPWEFRTGKVKRKFVEPDVEFWSKSECKKVINEYKDYVVQGRESNPISLNTYLSTAAIALRAAFSDKSDKSPLELYQAHADFRHGGMLDINDPDSAEGFSKWLHSEERLGSHPFEIVFSIHHYGIQLTPPTFIQESEKRFTIDVGTYTYAEMYIKMLKALMSANVAIKTPEQSLKEVLDYLSGELYYTVNTISGENYVFYSGTKEEKKCYGNYIEWDELPILKRIKRQ